MQKPERKYVQIAVMIFITAVAIMLAFFFIYSHQSVRSGIYTINKIVAPILYGLIFAYLLTPILNYIERKILFPLFNKIASFNKKTEEQKIKFTRKFSIILTYLLFFILMYLFFMAVVPAVYKNLKRIVTLYSVYTQNLIDWGNQILANNPEFAKYFSNAIKNYSTETDDWLNSFVLPSFQKYFPNFKIALVSVSSSVLTFLKILWNIVIGLIISVYVLGSKEKFAKSCTRLLYAFLERKTANRVLDSVRFTHRKFIGFFSGKIIDSIIIGIIAFICCTIMKMPYTALISVVIGVTNIIPFFGPWFGAIPSVLIILMVNPSKVIPFLIFIFILQQVDGNLIGPKILSESTGLSSFWIICSITIFSGLFGVIGMIIAVPVTAVLFAGFNSLTEHLLKKKNLPTDENTYFKVGEINESGQITDYEYEKPKKKKPKTLMYKIVHFVKKITKVFKEKKTTNE